MAPCVLGERLLRDYSGARHITRHGRVLDQHLRDWRLTGAVPQESDAVPAVQHGGVIDCRARPMDIKAIRIGHIPGSLNLDTPYGQARSLPIHGVPGRIANGDLVKGGVVARGSDHLRIIFIDGFLWLIDLRCHQVPPGLAGPVVHVAVSSPVHNAVVRLSP